MGSRVTERIVVKARPTIKVYRGEIKPENLIREIKGPNLIVNNGLKDIMDKLGEDVSGSAVSGPTYVWVGSGSTAPANSDTDMAFFESEKAFANYVRAGGLYTGTWDATYGLTDGNHEWEEVAMANGAHGTGTMWTRYVFTAQKFTKTNTEQVLVEYELTISRV